MSSLGYNFSFSASLSFMCVHRSFISIMRSPKSFLHLHCALISPLPTLSDTMWRIRRYEILVLSHFVWTHHTRLKLCSTLVIRGGPPKVDVAVEFRSPSHMLSKPSSHLIWTLSNVSRRRYFTWNYCCGCISLMTWRYAFLFSMKLLQSNSKC